MRPRLILLLLGVMPIVATQAQNLEPTANTTADEPPGWHFYKFKPSPSPTETAVVTPTPAPGPTPPPVKKVELQPTPEPPAGPQILTTEWIRQEYQRALDVATENPTQENVLRYLALNKITLDRASAFTKSVVEVKALNPIFSETSSGNPLNSQGRALRSSDAVQARAEAVTRIFETAGLWYFYRSDCPYCQRQQLIFNALRQKYNVPMTAISLDGKPPPPDYAPEKWIPDNGHSQRLGVTRTPTIYLVEPSTAKIVPVAEGLMTLAQLQEALIESAHAAQIIESDLYHRATQRVQPRGTDDIEHLIRELYADGTSVTPNADATKGQ